MKKCLMTVMAAAALGGMFTGCTKDADLSGGQNSAEFNIVQNYEKAFITRFGQPAANQTWGFGSASAGTRAVVGQPSVTEMGYTFNAQMAKAWEGIDGTPTVMANYTSWRNSGWNDKFYQVNGTVVSANIDATLREKAYTAILEKIPEGGPGNGQNNLTTASATGYSIVTKGGPVTLTPIYHYSGSGDKISYYYYPENSTPNVKTIEKYTIGNMADPEACAANNRALNEYTYSLVYNGPDGPTYEFPAGYVINFIISNTDLVNGSLTIADGTQPSLTSVGRYVLPNNETIQSGTQRDVIDGKVRIKFGNSTIYPAFSQTITENDNYFNIWGNRFNSYYKGNGVNGSLNAGSTCYYLKAVESGYLWVVVRANNVNNLKVYEVGDDWDSTDNNVVTPTEKPSNNATGVCKFPVSSGKVYAVYAENEQLCYYGYALLNEGQSSILECNAVPGGWPESGADNCGTIYKNAYNTYKKVYLKLGKAPNPLPSPVYFNTTKDSHPITNYPYYTEGIENHNGGFDADATTYFIRPTQNGVIRVAVKLSGNNTGNYKTLKVIDLGEWGWYNTSGNEVLSETNNSAESIYGTYDFNVMANHVYAVYAQGSKLGFYGLELLANSNGTTLATKTIPNTPEFYGDGTYNTAVHQSTIPLGEGYHWAVTPSNTSHIAVFKTEYTDAEGNTVDLNLIGFEDWTDLDYNDVIFAVTGTRGGEEIEIEEPDEPEPDFICRVIAEDLTVSDNTDFDFNDVVFDVYSNGRIRIRACGGTLPLTVDGQEVHGLFGKGTGEMINTGWDGEIEYENRYHDIMYSGGSVADVSAANAIVVQVQKQGGWITLSAPVGEVASKIAVGNDYEWCRERQDIDSKWHLKDGTRTFSDFVRGITIGNDWYRMVIEEAAKYQNKKNH